MKPLRIVLADDHRLFRKGIAALLAERSDVVIVGEAGDGLEAVNMVRATVPDVVLMDLNMPILGGLDAIRMIKQEMPEVQIIVLTISENDRDLITAIKFGAQGYLLKNMEPDQLYEILDATRRGEVILPRNALEKLRQGYHDPEAKSTISPSKISGLTQREIQILELVARGNTNKEIAAALFITESTVKLHLHNILGKTQLNNRIQLAIYAVGQGLGGGYNHPAPASDLPQKPKIQ